MLMLYFPVTKIIKMSANEKWQTNWQSFLFFFKKFGIFPRLAYICSLIGTALSNKGLVRGPLKAEIRVRIPVALQKRRKLGEFPPWFVVEAYWPGRVSLS